MHCISQYAPRTADTCLYRMTGSAEAGCTRADGGLAGARKQQQTRAMTGAGPRHDPLGYSVTYDGGRPRPGVAMPGGTRETCGDLYRAAGGL